MENPGVFTLCAAQISAPQSSAYTPITDLDGISSATIVARFAYGSGGTSLIARIQTTLDGGQTWYDVARFDFAMAPVTRCATISGLQSQGVASLVSLAAEGINDGLLGNMFRVVIDSTGSYAGNTLLDIRMAAR